MIRHYTVLFKEDITYHRRTILGILALKTNQSLVLRLDTTGLQFPNVTNEEVQRRHFTDPFKFSGPQKVRGQGYNRGSEGLKNHPEGKTNKNTPPKKKVLADELAWVFKEEGDNLKWAKLQE